MRKTIKVQSVSDIITNSSSEVFCKIHSTNKKFIEDLYDQLYDVYGWNQESEMTPVIDYDIDDDFKPWTYDNYEEEQKAREASIDKSTINIEMPYRLRKALPYHRAGIEALIKQCSKAHRVKKDGIEVEFNDDF